MERLVLVHGSVVGGRATWAAQRPLAERFELVVVERPGFPPNPPATRVDFESDAALVAELLRDGDHLVGHSYGGVIALLAAAQRPDALALADGDRASGDPRRRWRPRRRRVRRGRRGAVRVGRDERPGGVPPRASSRPSARGSILPPAPAGSRAGRAGAHRSSAGRGRRRSRSTRSPRRRSRSSSSPGATTRPSTGSATCSSASSRPSASCSRATATSCSSIRSSTMRSPTSSSAPERALDGRLSGQELRVAMAGHRDRSVVRGRDVVERSFVLPPASLVERSSSRVAGHDGEPRPCRARSP